MPVSYGAASVFHFRRARVAFLFPARDVILAEKGALCPFVPERDALKEKERARSFLGAYYGGLMSAGVKPRSAPSRIDIIYCSQ